MESIDGRKNKIKSMERKRRENSHHCCVINCIICRTLGLRWHHSNYSFSNCVSLYTRLPAAMAQLHENEIIIMLILSSSIHCCESLTLAFQFNFFSLSAFFSFFFFNILNASMEHDSSVAFFHICDMKIIFSCNFPLLFEIFKL